MRFLRLSRSPDPLIRSIAAGLVLGAIVLLAWAEPGAPDPEARLAGAQLVRALRQGGLVIYFRHADTGAPYPEREPVDFQRCETQRNLNDHGREQARGIGEQFRRLGIPTGDVLTSEFCRCWQTAELAFARYSKVQALSGVSRDPASADRRALASAGLRELLASRPPDGVNTVLVSHGYNLFDLEHFLLGVQGEAAIYSPDGMGGYRLVARLAPDDWAALPQPAQ